MANAVKKLQRSFAYRVLKWFPSGMLAWMDAVSNFIDTFVLSEANVKQFGATGNGVSNDTAAIQAAMNSGAGTIFFPEGTYLSDVINVPATVAHIYGEAATIKQRTLAQNQFSLPATTQLLIEQLVFEGIPGDVNTNTTNNAIIASNCSGIRIIGNTFTGWRGLCVAFVGVTDFEIASNLDTSNSQGFYLQACARGHVHHNTHKSPQFSGFVSIILLDVNSGGTGNSDITIDNEVSTDYTNAHGVYVHTLARGTISGCTFKNVVLPIAIGGNLGVNDVIDRVAVVGNVCDCATVGTAGNGNVGISIESGPTKHITNVSIIGNSIYNANAIDLNTSLGGISCGYVDGLTIHDNTIVSPRCAGIAIENPVTRLSCRGNVIRDVVVSGGIQFGIYANSVPGGHSGLIEGNWIDVAAKGMVFSAASASLKIGRNRFTGVGSGNHYVNPSFCTFVAPITSSGTLTIANPNAADTVVFPEVEAGSTYKRGATVRSSTAGGGVGPYVIQTGSPTAAGFAIFLSAAPTGGNSVDVDWWIDWPDAG